MLKSPFSILWRVRVRKMYNEGNYLAAITFGRKRLNHPQDGEMAKSIVVRSLYNLAQYQEVERFSKKYPTEETNLYLDKAQRKLQSYRPKIIQTKLPSFDNLEWNNHDLLSNWYQEENILWLRHPNGWTYWMMPDGFLLEEVHESVLYLALEILLGPWVPETKNWNAMQSNKGINLALAYSGGVDSTAAALLLPNETILSYHQRDFDSMLSHNLPNKIFRAWSEINNREVLIVRSNHEKIRTYYGLPNGFSTAHAAGIHLILLSNHLDLRGIAFGTPIDNTWLRSGREYRDFSNSQYWLKWKKKFESAGLDYVLPINHISEAGAIKICMESNLADKINSCLRGKDGEACRNCWKCFHKNGPMGRDINPKSKEITTFLNTTPLRTAQHALWALKKQDLENLAPHLIQFIEEDLSWWEQAYPKGLEIIDQPLRAHIKEKTEDKIDWMSKPFKLESVDLKV